MLNTRIVFEDILNPWHEDEATIDQQLLVHINKKNIKQKHVFVMVQFLTYKQEVFCLSPWQHRFEITAKVSKLMQVHMNVLQTRFHESCKM